MCGRYFFTGMTDDEKLTAIVNMMERQYPGSYKTGEIFPGDTAPAVIQENGRIIPIPAVFGFPGFDGSRLLINARSETAAQKILKSLFTASFRFVHQSKASVCYYTVTG